MEGWEAVHGQHDRVLAKCLRHRDDLQLPGKIHGPEPQGSWANVEGILAKLPHSYSLYARLFYFTPDLQDLVWIPKLAVFGLVGQTDGIMELNYGGSQLVFGRCDGLVQSFDMTVIQVFEELPVLLTNESFLRKLNAWREAFQILQISLTLSLPLGVLQAWLLLVSIRVSDRYKSQMTIRRYFTDNLVPKCAPSSSSRRAWCTLAGAGSSCSGTASPPHWTSSSFPARRRPRPTGTSGWRWRGTRSTTRATTRTSGPTSGFRRDKHLRGYQWRLFISDTFLHITSLKMSHLSLLASVHLAHRPDIFAVHNDHHHKHLVIVRAGWSGIVRSKPILKFFQLLNFIPRGQFLYSPGSI